MAFLRSLFDSYDNQILWYKILVAKAARLPTFGQPDSVSWPLHLRDNQQLSWGKTKKPQSELYFLHTQTKTQEASGRIISVQIFKKGSAG